MRLVLLVCLFLVVFLTDQLTKALALGGLVEGVPVTVIPNFFDLTLVFNPGAAFGIFANFADEHRRLSLLVVSIIALMIVVHLLVVEARNDRLAQVSLALILGGAAGNIVDRVRFDSVVDFLDFYIGNYHWPAFNIADSAISLGVVLLIFRMVFHRPEQKPA